MPKVFPRRGTTLHQMPRAAIELEVKQKVLIQGESFDKRNIVWMEERKKNLQDR